MIPYRSPYGLIQEDLWPDEWKILVACMMLNCTSRKQVEKVFPEFVKRWPDAAVFMNAARFLCRGKDGCCAQMHRLFHENVERQDRVA